MEFSAFLATLFSTIFCGAAVYINVAEHPARMECGPDLAAQVFGPSYRRAAVMQASLAVLSAVSGIVTWFLGGSALWLLGAVLIFLVVPFTLIIIMPTNKQLMDTNRNISVETTQKLLEKWGKLHAVRSALSLFSSLVFLALLTQL